VGHGMYLTQSSGGAKYMITKYNRLFSLNYS
jgi:hypothetical protein